MLVAISARTFAEGVMTLDVHADRRHALPPLIVPVIVLRASRIVAHPIWLQPQHAQYLSARILSMHRCEFQRKILMIH